MNEVYNFLDSLNIFDKDALVIGVSFGPDSMFLLDLIKEKYEKNKIICAHVHHNHRKESDLEAEELKKYCVKHDIIFEFMKIGKYKDNKFTEEEAREKRYDFFEELIKKYNAQYLFTAHHGDDLIETILMKEVRGSTLSGYKGITLISNRNKYSIVRPLLFLTKDDITNFCNDKDIPYAVDKSNESEKYTRNRYRNKLLPILKQENKHVHKKFLDFSKELDDYDEFVSKIVSEKYELIVKENVVNLDELKQQQPFLQRKIIQKYLFENYTNDIKLINKAILKNILKLIESTKTTGNLSLPLSKTLSRSYNKLFFDNNIYYNDFQYVFENKVFLPNGFIIEKKDCLEDTTNYSTAFLSSEIQLPLIVRTKKDGDVISVLGLNGNKKVKDIFIDEKLSKHQRKVFPVVTDSNGVIVWLPGLKKSKYDKSKNGKYDIILRYYKKEENNAE